MSKFAGVLRATERIVVRGAIGISVAALSLIVLINILEIVSRTFFHVSFAWIYETNLLLAAWTYFLGIVPVYARNGDVSVVGLKQLLPERAQVQFERVIHVVGIATFAITAWFAAALIELQLPFRTPGSGLPNAVFTAPLLLGLLGLIVVLLNKFVTGERAVNAHPGGLAQ
jgi:TRAP-type C4-dicarboxylate transport system permease small subunit